MTLDETFGAIARLHRDAQEIQPALRKHAVAAASSDPALHGRLHRLELAVGELRAVLATLRARLN
jgi:hypothetical protein